MTCRLDVRDARYVNVVLRFGGSWHILQNETDMTSNNECEKEDVKIVGGCGTRCVAAVTKKKQDLSDQGFMSVVLGFVAAIFRGRQGHRASTPRHNAWLHRVESFCWVS